MTGADAGKAISATVTYPPSMAAYFGLFMGSMVPTLFTTNAVTVSKLTPTVKLTVPKKIKQGQRPAVYVTVKAGRTVVDGVVTFKVGKLRAQKASLSSGFAKFKLPKLKPGKYKVTASVAAGAAYKPAKATKTVVVKAKAKKAKRR